MALMLLVVILLVACKDDCNYQDGCSNINEINRQVRLGNIVYDYREDFQVINKDIYRLNKGEIDARLAEAGLSYLEILSSSLKGHEDVGLIKYRGRDYPSFIHATVVDSKFVKIMDLEFLQDKLLEELRAALPKDAQGLEEGLGLVRGEELPYLSYSSRAEGGQELKSARSFFIVEDKLYAFTLTTSQENFEEDEAYFREVLASIE